MLQESFSDFHVCESGSIKERLLNSRQTICGDHLTKAKSRCGGRSYIYDVGFLINCKSIFKLTTANFVDNILIFVGWVE